MPFAEHEDVGRREAEIVQMHGRIRSRTAATLFSIIGGALSGEAVVRGRSFFANRVGEMVATPSFTLLDDPLTHATLAPACTTARVWPVDETSS